MAPMAVVTIFTQVLNSNYTSSNYYCMLLSVLSLSFSWCFYLHTDGLGLQLAPFLAKKRCLSALFELKQADCVFVNCKWFLAEVSNQLACRLLVPFWAMLDLHIGVTKFCQCQLATLEVHFENFLMPQSLYSYMLPDIHKVWKESKQTLHWSLNGAALSETRGLSLK